MPEPETMAQPRRDMIPRVRELRFFAQVTIAILCAASIGIGLVYVLFNQELGQDFSGAVSTIHALSMRITPTVVLAIALQSAISAVVVYFAALRYSHKISGPMYRVRYVLKEYMEGRSVDRIIFRQGDFLVPIAEQLTELLNRQLYDDERIEEAVALLSDLNYDDPVDRAARLERLKKLVSELEQIHG